MKIAFFPAEVFDHDGWHMINGVPLSCCKAPISEYVNDNKPKIDLSWKGY
jgi:hypothetical protein